MKKNTPEKTIHTEFAPFFKVPPARLKLRHTLTFQVFGCGVCSTVLRPRPKTNTHYIKKKPHSCCKPRVHSLPVIGFLTPPSLGELVHYLGTIPNFERLGNIATGLYTLKKKKYL